MNGPTHRRVGALAGVATNVAFSFAEKKPIRLGHIVGGGFGGAFGGALPDILEPATTGSYHRSFFHGAAPTGGLVYGALKGLGDIRHNLEAAADDLYARAKGSESWVEEILLSIGAFLVDLLAGFLTGIPGGYASHVLLDATTPRSIPIVGLSRSF